MQTIPSTTRLIENKYKIFEKMMKARTYAHLVLPYCSCEDIEEVYAFIEQHEKLVFKPKRGRKGIGVYLLRREKNKYYWHDHEKVKTLNESQLNRVLSEMGEKEFFAQPFIDCRNKHNIPFDCRLHVQRNGRGDWVLNTGYARVGTEESIVTNTSRGGSIADMQYVLTQEFGREKGETCKQELERLSLELAQHVDGFYNFQVEEFGVDLAVDRQQKIWLFELNTVPMVSIKTFERACNRIDYALHIVRKGRMKEEEMQSNLIKTRELCRQVQDRVRLIRKNLGDMPLAEGEKLLILLQNDLEALSKTIQGLGTINTFPRDQDYLELVEKQIALEHIKYGCIHEKDAGDRDIILQELSDILESWFQTAELALKNLGRGGSW